jgi:hypothetical protein
MYYINFILKLVYLKRNSNKYLQFEHMKYICVEKIHITKYEKLQIYFKIKVMVEVL